MRVIYWAAVTALGFASSSLAAAVNRRAPYGYDDEPVISTGRPGGKGGRPVVTVTKYVTGGKLGYSTKTGGKTDTVYIITTSRKGGKPAPEYDDGDVVTITKTKGPKPTVFITSYVTGGKLGTSTKTGAKTDTVYIVTTKKGGKPVATVTETEEDEDGDTVTVTNTKTKNPKPTVYITTYVTGGKLGPSTATGGKTVTVFIVTTKKAKPTATVTETEEEPEEPEEEEEDGDTVTVTNTKTKPKVTVTATTYVTGGSLGLSTKTGAKTDTVFIVTTSKSRQTATVTKTEEPEDDEDDATVTVTNTKTNPKVTVTATTYVTGGSLGLSTATGGKTDTVFIVTTSNAPRPSSKPDTSCGNAGLEVAIFNNPFLNQQEVANKGFNVNYFTSALPYDDTSADSIGWNGALSATKYSHLYTKNPPHGFTARQTHMEGPTFALMYRGYFYAPTTQEYTIYTYDVDDRFYYWLGDNAFDWSEANHDYRNNRVKVRIEGGTYYPIRILYANGGGGGEFHLDITGGDGVDYVKATRPSDYLISRSCDGKAKRFPSWDTSEYGSYVAGAKRPDISCGNVAGMLFVAFENIWPNQHSNNRIPGFNPNYYKTCKKAFAQGTTRMIGMKGTSGLNPYGLWAPQNVPSVPLLTMHRGFFYVPRDGHYTFHIAGIKDGGWMWFGQKAYTAWTASNYDCRYLLKTGIGGYNEDAHTVHLTAGTYFPFRIMIADGGEGGTFNLEIFDNQGNFYLEKFVPAYILFIEFMKFKHLQMSAGVVFPF
ncbi:hypothetical protein TWF191_005939 [Orbilia oligospora]|uniref:PA14 domain-containing protein n=1 Tax=Orbilia oligospora TaxID=2813651 RepID=A0A7C8QS15_ORBOL|nr:hypothetical protein TWF191_005939 [Orbilia oligospora]